MRLLGQGWASPTAHGTWSASPVAQLTLPGVAGARDLGLEITLDPQRDPGVACPVHCRVAVNGTTLGERAIAGPLRWLLLIPDAAAAEALVIRIILPGDSAIRLSAITIVAVKPVQLPTSPVPLRELRFGWNDDGNDWLGDGWGRPEGEYVWAIGGASTLRLPVEPDGSPQCALLDMRPFHRPPSPPRQRIIVRADGCPPLHIDLRDRLINAIPLRPRQGQAETVLTFEHQDAGYETSDPFFHYGKPFAWALSSARIMPAQPRFFPGGRPAVPGSLEDVTMRQAVFARLGMSVPDLADHFIGLGNCCEFGALQRAEGKDRPGLLRLAALRQRELVEGLFTGFQGVGRIEHLSYRPDPANAHWRMTEAFYVMGFPTPFRDAEPFPPGEVIRQSRRLPRLAEILVEDMVDGERIFVLRLADPGAGEPALLAVQAALRRFGDAALVWLVNDGTSPAGSAERLACGVVRGHIEPPHVCLATPAETVVSIMANALILLRQGQKLPP